MFQGNFCEIVLYRKVLRMYCTFILIRCCFLQINFDAYFRCSGSCFGRFCKTELPLLTARGCSIQIYAVGTVFGPAHMVH